MSRNYDNWERLVDATLKRELLRYIALYCESFSSTTSEFSVDSLLSIAHIAEASGVPCNMTSDSELDDPFSIERSCTTESLLTGIIPLSHSVKFITFKELEAATNSFAPGWILGTGLFGNVYKGWIDEHTLTATRPGDGMSIAVKKWSSWSYPGQGEWLTEIHYLGNLHHSNLVKLIGYCFKDDEVLLVHEFMPEGSLEDHLFTRAHDSLSWNARIKVAIGAARGLCFLHGLERQVIHRSIKSSNILLDRELNAKLSGFGLAIDGPSGDKTHVSTLVIGTYGYSCPEYIATGQLRAGCDVYSFGVVLLELLCGRRVIDRTKGGIERNLVKWARPFLNNRRKLFKIMDPRLVGRYPWKEAQSAALVAFRCLGRKQENRPGMAEVLVALDRFRAPKTHEMCRFRISKCI